MNSEKHIPPDASAGQAQAQAQAQAQEAQHLAQKHVENTAGTTVHTFDDSMTPEQKKEQAEKRIPADMLPSKELNQEPGAMATDVPSVDAEQIRLAAASAEKKPTAPTATIAKSESQQQKSTPGAYTKIPNYYRCGWTAFSTLENPGGSIQLRAAEIPEDPFGDQLKESWYGEWWHNSGVLFFTGFFTWFLIKMGGGLASVMVVCAFLGELHTPSKTTPTCRYPRFNPVHFTATYYQTSIKRLRRNIRDDIQREVIKNNLDGDFESMHWLNTFLGKMLTPPCLYT